MGNPHAWTDGKPRVKPFRRQNIDVPTQTGLWENRMGDRRRGVPLTAILLIYVLFIETLEILQRSMCQAQLIKSNQNLTNKKLKLLYLIWYSDVILHK